MISNRQLEVFAAVYEERSMTAAARKIHMTQPAVSQMIKDIENAYETKLFERYGSRLHVTQAGNILYDYARRIMNLYTDLDEEIRRNEGVREIRIGGNISVGTAQMIYLVDEFNKLHPDIKVKVMVYQAPVIMNAILNNELDVAMVEDQTGNSFSGEFISEPYYLDKIVITASPEHRFAGKTVKLKELQNENFLFRERGAGVRDKFDHILRSHDVNVNVVWQCTSTEAIVSAVSRNMGISVLPYLLVKDFLDKGVINEIKLSDVSLSRNLNIIFHKDKVITKPLEDFINIVRSFGKNNEEGAIRR